jgi:chemotaxis protein histidine kinase CheA
LFRALTWQWGPFAFAVPLFAVEKVIQLDERQSQKLQKRYRYKNASIPLIDMEKQLDIPLGKGKGAIGAIAILAVDGDRKALPIPADFVEQELILRPMASLARFPKLSGAAVSEASAPLLILNHRIV